ncbi:hypothetical protein BD626DRAFT_396574, partial [Schizophyllum amplum]
MPVHVVELEGGFASEGGGVAQPQVDVDADRSLFTRRTDPFAPRRVQAVLEAVRIGDDLSPEQRNTVIQFVREFADCFALSMHEVTAVPGATHRMDIPADTQFSTKPRQKPFTPLQKRWVNKVIDQMLEAGIITPIHPKDARCVSPTTLAQKAH